MKHNFLYTLPVLVLVSGSHPCFSSANSGSDTSTSESDSESFDHAHAFQETNQAFHDGAVQLRYLATHERQTIEALCLEMPDSTESGAYLPPSSLKEEVESLQEELYKSERAKHVLGQLYPSYIMQLELVRGKLTYAQHDLEESNAALQQARGIIAAQVDEIARLRAQLAELAAKLTVQSCTEEEKKLAGASPSVPSAAFASCDM